MAVGFEHPNVTVHVADGFAFLKNHTNEFDVIITDSSDPEGPAESLFQKPYFELLYAALRDGGVITTQGCKPSPLPPRPLNILPRSLNLLRLLERVVDVVFVRGCKSPASGWPNLVIAENQWLHLSLIQGLKKSCKEVFPVAEYAYTTIPTYPSGQIGFMVCCKDANRDVKKPLRSWSVEEEEKLCRYYSKEIHEAAFVLPTFARKALR
jgi:spermidine synthase